MRSLVPAAALCALGLASAARSCSLVVWTCDLQAVDGNGGTLEVGDTVEWRLEGVNAGCFLIGPAAHIELPPGQVPVSLPPGATWDPVSRDLSWNLPAAGPGGRAIQTFRTRVESASTPPACARGFIHDSYARCSDGRVRGDLICVPASGAALQATLTWSEGGDGHYAPLEPVRLRADLASTGNADLTPVALTVELPAEVGGWTLAGLPPGAIDRSDLAAGRLALEGIRLAPGDRTEVVLEGAVLAGTAPALRACARGQASSPALPGPIAAIPADRIAGPTCFTTDPAPGQLAISALRPCRASVGGGDRIVIEGARFERDALVLLDGQPIAVESVDPGRIVFVASPRTTAGASDIQVRSPRGPQAEALQALGWTAVTMNLRLTKNGSDVKLAWNGAWGVSTIERSETPDFPCGTPAFSAGTTKQFFDPTLGDGRTWFYRAP